MSREANGSSNSGGEGEAPSHRAPTIRLGTKARRTRQLIMETAQRVFLENGYTGTRIDQITQACNVSRASFYTYFPSKSDLLNAIARQAAQEGEAVAQKLEVIAPDRDIGALSDWVEEYLSFMDRHGAFVYIWDQVGADRPELKKFGLKLRQDAGTAMGRSLIAIRGLDDEDAGVDATIQGVALLAMLERFWYLWRVAGMEFDPTSVARSLARFLAGN